MSRQLFFSNNGVEDKREKRMYEDDTITIVFSVRLLRSFSLSPYFCLRLGMIHISHLNEAHSAVISNLICKQ